MGDESKGGFQEGLKIALGIFAGLAIASVATCGACLGLGVLGSSINQPPSTSSNQRGGIADPPPTIEDVSTKVTESNSTWSKFAWQMKVRNYSDSSEKVDIQVKWVDEDGYVVDDARKYGVSLPRDGTRKLTDYQLIDASVAGDVNAIEAEIVR